MRVFLKKLFRFPSCLLFLDPPSLRKAYKFITTKPCGQKVPWMLLTFRDVFFSLWTKWLVQPKKFKKSNHNKSQTLLQQVFDWEKKQPICVSGVIFAKISLMILFQGFDFTRKFRVIQELFFCWWQEIDVRRNHCKNQTEAMFTLKKEEWYCWWFRNPAAPGMHKSW